MNYFLIKKLADLVSEGKVYNHDDNEYPNCFQKVKEIKISSTNEIVFVSQAKSDELTEKEENLKMLTELKDYLNKNFVKMVDNTEATWKATEYYIDREDGKLIVSHDP
jgi:uncharacterized UPF0160 family protein